jgi:uridine monophosphate synthetase
LDREQGGPENITEHSVRLHSILKTSDVLEVLLQNKRINDDIYKQTNEFLLKNKHVPIKKAKINDIIIGEGAKTFESRGKLCSNKVAKSLYQIMVEKKTNLCVAADFTKFDQLLTMADQIGPHICVLKTHIDIINDFNIENVQKLSQIASKHNFLIFEDRKFADIGNTVKKQFTDGPFKISKWANIVNAHSICGNGSIKGLKEGSGENSSACLLIGQLSSSGNLIDDNYTKETVRLAEENSDFVIGFICQKKLSSNPKFIHMTPGKLINKT